MKTLVYALLSLLAGFVVAVLFIGSKTVEVVKEVPKPVQVVKTNTVDRWHTNLIERWRTNEVVKTVEVPANLTQEQEHAIGFFARYVGAPVLTNEEALYKLTAFDVQVQMNDAVRELLSEDELKTKVELTLRRHGVKIDPESVPMLSFAVEGMWNDDKVFLSYSLRLKVIETVRIMRAGEIWRVSPWPNRSPPSGRRAGMVEAGACSDSNGRHGTGAHHLISVPSCWQRSSTAGSWPRRSLASMTLA